MGLWTLLVCSQFRSSSSYSPPLVPFEHLLWIVLLGASITISFKYLLLKFYVIVPSAILRGTFNTFQAVFRFLVLVIVMACVIQFREMLGYGMGHELPKWPILIILAVCVAVIFLGGDYRRSYLIRYFATVGILILSFNLCSYAWTKFSNLEYQQASQPGKKAPSSRLIFVVFDELDGSLFLPTHRNDLANWMPATYKLIERSINYSTVSSSADNTFEAVPSILIGTELKSLNQPKKLPIWLNEFGQSYQGFDKIIQSGLLHLDSRVRSRNIGYIGWYHPYCRHIQSLNDCAQLDTTDNLSDSFLYTFNHAAWCRHLGICLYSRDKSTHAYRAIRAINDAKALLEDHSVLFIHLPVPHSPCSRILYAEKIIDIGSEGVQCGYFDSIKLADYAV